MSHKEADRLGGIQSVIALRLRQKEADSQLGIGVRQTKRLVRRYQDEGAARLAFGHRFQETLSPGGLIRLKACRPILYPASYC